MIAKSYFSVITTPKIEYTLTNTAYMLKSVGENKREIKGAKIMGNICDTTVPLIKMAVLRINSELLSEYVICFNSRYTFKN